MCGVLLVIIGVTDLIRIISAEPGSTFPALYIDAVLRILTFVSITNVKK